MRCGGYVRDSQETGAPGVGHTDTGAGSSTDSLHNGWTSTAQGVLSFFKGGL